MIRPRLIRWLLTGAIAVIQLPVLAQTQACPANINFAAGDISSWSAETGLKSGASQSYPAPNTGVSTVPEYHLSNTGIQVITTSSADPFGGFPTIPTINGYAYKYSVKLGSTATSWDLHANRNNPGGFRRSVTYEIEVPAGPTDVPYTITYAYAMVLENGTHNSDQQPMFKATLSTKSGVISCASPEYYLPTFNNAGGAGGLTGATLDSAAARAEGFTLSPRLFLSHAGARNNAGTLLHDVWTKGWTEVTFDLSPYRGQTVTLSFEADNCAPGAHFAYAYVALRNNCAGLQISGNKVACTGSLLTYSVPALASAHYEWSVPAGWTIKSGATSNVLKVVPGNSGGLLIIHEQNSCANLRDTLIITTSPPTIAGKITGDATVCAGLNDIPLTLQGARGNILGWLSSTDGIRWKTVDNTSGSYTAQNLDTTTRYAALIQNGATCNIDTSAAAVVTVNARSAAGSLSPSAVNVCAGQSTGSLLTLTGNTGPVLNWQFSYNNAAWNDFSPADHDSSYSISAINKTTYYRLLVKNGVCPVDTSTVAVTTFIHTPAPRVTIHPATSSICYGDSVRLTADISVGTNYTWTPADNLTNPGTGVIHDAPALIETTAKPEDTVDYVLTVSNAGCPNSVMDTFQVAVNPPVRVFAGNDTIVTAGEPLQLNAAVDRPYADAFEWTPATGLNFTNTDHPVATLDTRTDSITYTVRATDAAGCYGEDSLTVAVFKTGADIFVPTAFTPNGDGMNDLLVPVCVGIRQLIFFKIYDRWGRLVFSTKRIGQGWNGEINGKDQPTGGFVYMAEGIDYTGKTLFKKGSFLLIR